QARSAALLLHHYPFFHLRVLPKVAGLPDIYDKNSRLSEVLALVMTGLVVYAVKLLSKVERFTTGQ
ncbi:MAG TPA: hypothetical protein VLD57_02595, partial [Blastocatellia bacterium]|nr:hypothetical protein [Blastocatellia bacterium]